MCDEEDDDEDRCTCVFELEREMLELFWRFIELDDEDDEEG